MQTVWVKAIGLGVTDMQSVTTALGLRQSPDVRYRLWQPDTPADQQCDVVIVDADSFDAGLELLSLSSTRDVKVIQIGASAQVSGVLQLVRPLIALDLLTVLDDWFVHGTAADEKAANKSASAVLPPVRQVLVVDMPLPDAMYLRARMALAYLTDLDVLSEIPTWLQTAGHEPLQMWQYAFLYADGTDAAAWKWLKALQALEFKPLKIVMVLAMGCEHLEQQAIASGCWRVLHAPLQPEQLIDCLQGLQAL